MELRNVKGTRDLLPADKLARDSLIAKLKAIFEKYGYNPIETPALELQETLASKYAGGAEILQEVFTLKDNADRDLGLRYDLTVPFARVIASNQELKRPFKRYQIDRVWRNGPIKLGRYREFYQCDVDVVGISSVAAEAELWRMMEDFFSTLDVPIVIKVNNRKILSSVMQYAGISAVQESDAMLSLDKLAKIGVSGVKKEMAEKGISDEQADKLLSICASGKSNPSGSSQNSNSISLADLKKKIPDCVGVKELEDAFALAKSFGVGAASVQFDVSLARGLSYYTGMIWEAFFVDNKITSSIGGGGRYDNMVGSFLNNRESIPAVGTSFGLDVIIDGLKLAGKLDVRESVVTVYVIPIKTLPASIGIVQELRSAGISADIDMNGKGPSKNMEYVNRYKIPFALVIGDNEITSGKLMLKNMANGEQEQLSIADIITLLTNFNPPQK